MVTLTTNTQDRPAGVVRRIFDHIGAVAFFTRAANARIEKVTRLQNKSDEELAELGLKREDIARHVFRDILYI